MAHLSSNGPAAQAATKGHPPGLYLLFFVEMWERFSYYGMRGLLVLYLIAVFAVRELPSGTYTNDFEVTEIKQVKEKNKDTGKEEEVAKDGASRVQTLHLAIGQSGFTPPPVTVKTEGTLPLVVQRLKEVDDPAKPGEKMWTPDSGATDSPLVVAGPAGGPFSNSAFAYRVTNPTDKPIKARIGIIRPSESYRPYFTVNRKPGGLTVDVKPDAEIKGDDKPLDVIVRINETSSGRFWSESVANKLYGWYTGLAYLFPILGGILADKLIGTRRSMLVGGLLISMGHIILGISGLGDLAHSPLGMSLFITGLAVIVLGTGHFKPTVSVMVGQLYSQDDPRRDGAFTIFYMGINLGAFICAFTCGTLGETVGWHWGFASAAVGMLIGLATYVIGQPKLLPGIGEAPKPKGTANGASLAVFIVALALSAGFGLLFHSGFFASVDRAMNELQSQPVLAASIIGVLGAGILGWIIWFLSINRPEDRGPVITIFVFMFFNAFFWIAFEQAGSSINVFTEQNTNRHIGAFEVPATWFQSVNAGLIFILAPLFAAIWTRLGARGRDPSQPVKIALGLIFLGLGYVFMVVAGRITASGSAQAGMWFVLATYFWHTVGELCLSPTGLSYVTKAAPARFVSLLMGIWFISSFIANLGGGLIASQVEEIEKGNIKLWWNFGGKADFFFLFFVTSILAGLVILILTPVMKKLMRPGT